MKCDDIYGDAWQKSYGAVYGPVSSGFSRETGPLCGTNGVEIVEQDTSR